VRHLSVPDRITHTLVRNTSHTLQLCRAAGGRSSRRRATGARRPRPFFLSCFRPKHLVQSLPPRAAEHQLEEVASRQTNGDDRLGVVCGTAQEHQRGREEDRAQDKAEALHGTASLRRVELLRLQSLQPLVPRVVDPRTHRACLHPLRRERPRQQCAAVDDGFVTVDANSPSGPAPGVRRRPPHCTRRSCVSCKPRGRTPGSSRPSAASSPAGRKPTPTASHHRGPARRRTPCNRLLHPTKGPRSWLASRDLSC
jgi:hypothetical protein